MAARSTPLVPLQGASAARVRRLRSVPAGWVPVYLGLVATTDSDKRTRWLAAEHASHWAWPTLDAANRYMQRHRKQGQATLVLQVWAPARLAVTEGLVEVGPPRHDEPYVRSLCWVITQDDVPDTWSRQVGQGSGPLEWRHRTPGEAEVLGLRPPSKEHVFRPARGRYAPAMGLPNSSTARAKVALGDYYVEHGILPTVQRLAELLGMASTSSAHYVIKRLREEGYLGSSEHGKLTPGPDFLKAPSFPAIPTELLSQLPAGPGLRVLRVDDTWTLDGSIWEGDLLILAPESTAPGEADLLVLKRGSTRVLANEPRSGWRVEGVVLGQYRTHRR